MLICFSVTSMSNLSFITRVAIGATNVLTKININSDPYLRCTSTVIDALLERKQPDARTGDNSV